MNLELFIRHALEMAITLPAALIAFLPVKKYLKLGFVKTLLATGAFLTAFSLLGAAACVRFDVETSFVLLPLLLLCLELYFLMVDLNTSKKLFCFFNAAMLCSFSTVYCVIVTAPTEPDSGPFTIRSGLLCLFFTAILIVLFYKTLNIKLPYLLGEERLNRSWTTLTPVLVGLCVFFYYINPVQVSAVREGRLRTIGLLGFAMYPIAIFALYHLFWWTSMQLNETAQLKQENTMLGMEKKRYDELRLYMDETRTLRHDFRQHMRVITELAAEERYGELKNYINQFSDIVKKGYTPFCRNMAVDAVASHYAALADNKNIRIDWDLRLPEVLPIPETDFCALLGNLLENALNATEKVAEERRRVDVVCSMITENMLGLTVDNPYTGKIRFDQDHLPVSREPGHGIGMLSIASTVQRYNGTLDIKTKDGIFSVSIMLYLKNEEHEKEGELS